MLEMKVEAKIVAARAAVDLVLSQNFNIIGIGSGTTLSSFIKEFHNRLTSERRNTIQCVPTSYQSKLELLRYGFVVMDPITVEHVDIAVDGADEVDHACNCIKGGGGCHAQEMLIAKMAKVYYIVVDCGKVSQQLGHKWKRGIPIEVLPHSLTYVQCLIRKKLGGMCVMRTGAGKMGPVITDNGNIIIDWLFENVPHDWQDTYRTLKQMTGIVEVGLFVGLTDTIITADDQGNITYLTRQNK